MNSSTKQERSPKRLFILALAFALLAGIGTVFYLNILETRLRKKMQPPVQSMTAVVVANTDLAAGTVINSESVSIRKVPTEYVGPDSITPNQFGSVAGAILIKPLKHGKILIKDFIDLNIAKDFSGTIREGNRAITMQVDEINSISGMVRPGNHIDLFVRLAGSTGRAQYGGNFVIPVLENVLVLATGPSSARPNEDEFVHLDQVDHDRRYNTLTLELSPKNIALLSVAESRGSLIAALRNSKDTSGALFERISLQDLIAHSGELLADAISKKQNRSLKGIHKNSKGQLVTADGIVIKDPNVHLNKEGLLVTKDGKVLTGRNLHIGADGMLHTTDGKAVDTANLVVSGKDGTLIDKNGNVLDSNGYHTTKDGFLVDKNGNNMTPDGHIIKGLTLGKDGLVRTSDGQIVKAADISVDKDGTVRLKNGIPSLHIEKDGTIQTADGKNLTAKDLVTVGPDGVVRTKDGEILTGVHMGKDGKLYDKNGKELSPANVLMAENGYKAGKDGTIINKNGKILHAKDMVTVGNDGLIRSKDGTILQGVTMGKDGILRDASGNVLNAQDIAERMAIAKDTAIGNKGKILPGVSATYDPTFTASLGRVEKAIQTLHRLYEVEYIVGGTSKGAAKSFKVQIEDDVKPALQGKQ